MIKCFYLKGIHLNNLFIYLFIYLFIILQNIYCECSINGNIFYDQNHPIDKAEIRILDYYNYPFGKLLNEVKSEKSGYFSLSNIIRNHYILYINKFGYSPFCSSIIFTNNNDNITFKIKLKKYCIPEILNKINLNISNKTLISNISLRLSGNNWLGNMFLSNGIYYYSFHINDEKYGYIDLNNSNFVYNGFGDYISWLNIIKNSNVQFVFKPNLYSRYGLNSNDWYNKKERQEKLIKVSKPAKEFLIEKLKQNKIVFLGELHTIINPVVFLANHLKDLYKEGGLRYLFLESGSEDITNNQYYFPVLWVWERAGWRYEWIYLFKSISLLNHDLPKDQQLEVIFPEHGYHDINNPLNNPDLAYQNLINRDKFAYNTIISTISNSKDQDKVLIFYGDAHGIKKEITNFLIHDTYFHYKSLTSMLEKIYPGKFYSIESFIDNYSEKTNFLPYYYFNYVQNIIPFGGELSNNYIGKFHYENEVIEKFWDGFIYFGDSQVGTPHNYLNNNNTAKNLLYYIKLFYLNNTPDYFIKNQFQKDLYFLNVYYPKDFDYQYWNPKRPLFECITNFENFLYTNKIIDYTNYGIGNSNLENYLTCLYNGKIALDYSNYIDSIYFLKKSENYFTNDIYPDYFVFLDYYGLKNYYLAINKGQSLLSNNIINSLPELPSLYSNLADSYLHIADTNNYYFYLSISTNLKKELISREFLYKGKGAIIINVIESSQTEKLLKFGDIIITYNGKGISNTEDLLKNRINDISKDVVIEYIRQGIKNKIIIKGGPIGVNCITY